MSYLDSEHRRPFTMRKTIAPEFRVSSSWLQTKNTLARLECGHFALVCSGEHTNTIPKSMPCETCGNIEDHRASLLDWQTKGLISHTRAQYNHSGNYYTVLVYGHNSESPSGVTLLGCVPDVSELRDILTNKLAPLSPTER